MKTVPRRRGCGSPSAGIVRCLDFGVLIGLGVIEHESASKMERWRPDAAAAARTIWATRFNLASLSSLLEYSFWLWATPRRGKRGDHSSDQEDRRDSHGFSWRGEEERCRGNGRDGAALLGRGEGGRRQRHSR